MSLKIALFVSLMLSLGGHTYSQIPVGYSAECTIDQFNGSDILIQDNDTITLRFNVTDADLTDLAGFQSLCAVRLDFSHRNLSDLEITLTAPNGNRITLIGPAVAGGTQPSPAFDINFDVYFVAPPAPDDPHPFLLSPWSNNLGATWLQSSDYGGIYYPSVGDWSIDFDEGSVLGIWELTIIDNFLNEEGILRGFELDFCEDAGLVCDICESEEGTFIDTSLVFCANSNIDFNNIYLPGSADPNLYTDDFLIYDENGDFVVATDSNTTSLDSGSYTVHAINILTTEYDTANIGLQSLHRDVLIDSIQAAGGLLCMSLSDGINLEVVVPDTIFSDTILCFGSSIDFGGASVTMPGQYFLVSNECDTIEVLEVSASTLDVIWDIDTVRLTCNPDFIEVGPVVIDPVGTVIYQWSDGNDQVIGLDSTLMVNAPGDYQLTVTDDICDTSFSFTAIFNGENFFVDLVASPTQLNCVQDSTDILYTSNFSADSVLWFQDGTEIARGVSIINVRMEAEYVVQLFGEDGCVLSDTVNVISNQSDPDAIVNFADITCTQPTITVDYSTSDAILQAIWLTMDDTLGIGPDIVIDSGGDYRLHLIGQNLCESEFSFSVNADTDPIAINDVPSGIVTLNCSERSRVITPDRDANRVVEEYWILGVDDTVRGSLDITITEANSYRYQVITDNGCRQTERFDVVVDTLAPTYLIIPDSVTCDNNEPEIVLSRLGSGVTATFTGNEVISQTDSSVIVANPGLIEFVVIDASNGCSVADAFDVTIDESIPIVTISGDSAITCAMPEAELVADLNGVLLSNFYWIRPNADTVFERSHVTSDTGVYYFEAIGTNGCFLRDSFSVSQNDFVPNISLPNVLVVDCTSPNATMVINDSLDFTSIRYIIDEDTINGASLDRFTRSNSLEVQVVGLNGCSNGMVINITYDTLNPQLMLVSDTLNCNNSSVEIRPDILLNQHALTWAGEDIAGQTTDLVSVSQPGAYALNVVDTISGCDTLVVIDIMSNFDPPTYSVLPFDTITCDRTSANISLNTSLRNEVTWTTSDNRVETGPTILTGTPGLHFFSIVGSNGCDVVDSLLLVEDLSTPQVDIQTDYVISCIDLSHELVPNILDPFRSVLWNYKSGVSSTNLSQTIFDDDLASLVVTGDNGCPTEVSFDISFADDNPIAIINPVNTLDCEGQEIDLSTDPVVSPNHRIFWSLEGTNIGMDETLIAASISGEYVLEVIDTSSGCGTFDTISVLISPEPFSGFDAVVMDETCQGNNNGMISIDQVFGGFGNLEITANGEDLGFMELDQLPPASYLIQIEDDLGCIMDSTLLVQEGGVLEVELGEDIEIDRGDKATVTAEFIGDPVSSISWTSEQGFSAVDQDTFCFFPSVDQFVFIEATSESGCVVSDTLMVRVVLNLDKINVYIPNILSLESNQGNDEIIVSLPPDVIEMTDFHIFDRWGQKVVSIDRLVNGEIVVVWDGTFNGQDVASGVYVFSYEILTIHDDQRLRRSGDITIIN